MKYEIKHRYTGAALFALETGSFDLCVEAAVRAGANLRHANFWGADLSGASLRGANLRGADFRSADFRSAILRGADLRSADLRSANLRGAILSGADLSGADLSDADLSGADLSGADLRGADLSGAINAALTIARTRILPDGAIIGWKAVKTPRGSGIVKVLIPAEARRSHAFGRKCRAEFVDVLDAPDGAYTDTHGPHTEYRVGQRVHPDSWDTDWQTECSHGIHFFITREEAEV